jgi:hypothetical protein
MPSKLVNLGTQNQKSLVECEPKGLPERLLEKDPQTCEDQGDNKVNNWIDNLNNKKVGLGQAIRCDPMQTGQIVNDPYNPNSQNHVYRYSQGIRACDEAVQDTFRNLVVIDEDGKAHPVPIIWASQEKAVAWIMQYNVRKDDSLVVDRIPLPMLAVYSNSFQFAQSRYIYHKAVNYLRDNKRFKPGMTVSEKYERDTIFGVAAGIPVDIGYTLYAWAYYTEDMNQLLEQIILKFSPIAYIQVRGVQWETTLKLNSIASNTDVEPGDQNTRVIKYEFNLTAETYIPQPLLRQKAVLDMKVNFFNSSQPEQIVEVIDRLEEAVEELK